jgi:hypothetical protein
VLRSEPKPTTMQILEVGSNATIRSESGAVGIAIDKAAYDEFTKYAVANDVVGGQQMIDDGRVLVVSDGTKVKIIDLALTAYQVRIMSGPCAGRDGWVVREAVK